MQENIRRGAAVERMRVAEGRAQAEELVPKDPENRI